MSFKLNIFFLLLFGMYLFPEKTFSLIGPLIRIFYTNKEYKIINFVLLK